MQAAFAALPLVVVLASMVLLRWPAALAGAAGLGVAVAVWAGSGFAGGAYVLTGAAAEALSGTVVILWIILPALTIYEVQRRSGALERIRAALAALSGERAVQAVLVAWFFGLFMEGAAGFGTPVALAAPLLVGLGYGPVRAVAMALLGHAAGVSFGAVGTPVAAQVAALDLDGAALAVVIVALHALPAVGLAVAMMRLAVPGGGMGAREWRLAVLAAVCFLAPALVLAWSAGPELPTLGGALIGGAAFVALACGRGARLSGWRLADLLPYLLIVALVLASRLIAPVQQALAGLWLGWEWGAYGGGLAPLYHPGTLLATGLLCATLSTGRGGVLGAAVVAAGRRLLPVALALLVMLALARLMVHGAMIAALAQAAAGAGVVWPLVAPFIGVLGTFVTGSATASNILFSDFQAATAQALDLPVLPMAAAQGAGAAIGNAIAPHNIIAGAATVGLQGRDGEVLARTLLPVLLYAAAIGALVTAIAALS